MNTIGIIAVGIIIFVLVVFMITITNWDKKIEKGESLQQSKKGDAIAKFFLYLFVVAFIVFNIVVMNDCSRGSNIPFEETIRRN